MKRLLPLLAALFLLTACQKDTAMPTATSSPMPPQTNEEILAAAEEHLAAYRYFDAAAWAYELKQRGVALPPRLQAVLDEERYDPETPISTGSMYHLQPQQLARVQSLAEHGDRAAAHRLWQYYTFSAPNRDTEEGQAAAAYWAKQAGNTD
ncbi:hypothetical protein H9Q10_03205 [Eikenella sp. S3360]|uniref:Uncharacterized protein n=1 Tax=Eikenella glucosivorans TaxID=2766967 RepID=A0ABS0N8R9_9NEIS|nr:hypothetical protein [Eikenella glucosivorans]MBH5328675.1 hypothetical protein [Eikenella glucosivorans]